LHFIASTGSPSKHGREARTGMSLISGGQKKEKTNSEKDLQETNYHDANFIQLSL
jgi:hypothetical protein